MNRKVCLSITALLACAAPAFAGAQQADQLTVYRCTDATGAVSLQDQPCATHEAQQTRQMEVPVDAPVAPAATTPAAAPTPAPVVNQGPMPVATATPQPLYECRRPDGSVYESESGVPLRHWVPVALRMPNQPDMAHRVGRPRITAPQPAEAGASGANPTLLASGSWVEETCYALPAAEACARRRDQLAQLGKDWYLAFPSERDHIERQQQGLREQLRAECGDQ